MGLKENKENLEKVIDNIDELEGIKKHFEDVIKAEESKDSNQNDTKDDSKVADPLTLLMYAIEHPDDDDKMKAELDEDTWDSVKADLIGAYSNAFSEDDGDGNNLWDIMSAASKDQNDKLRSDIRDNIEAVKELIDEIEEDDAHGYYGSMQQPMAKALKAIDAASTSLAKLIARFSVFNDVDDYFHSGDDEEAND